MGVKRNIDEAGILDNSAKITEDEAALYDRQIRLWGLESQKRLREANILVIGLNGVGAEAVKNLTLIGVKSISILDETEVTQADTTSQFFLSSFKPGQQRAQASASAIRELNPNVNINILSGDLFSKSEEFYKDFDAMIATDCAVDVLIKLDNLCRKHDIQFYCADTWGFYGYCFLDLKNYEFDSYIVIKKGEKKKIKMAIDKPKRYCPLGPTLLTKVGEGLRKRVNKVFVLLHVVNHFREMFNRYPNPESRENDVEELKKLRNIVCEKLAYDSSKISDEMLSSVFGQLSPVCAVVGGVLANELIKGLTKSNPPVHNYFLYDGYETMGFNESIIVE